MDSAAYEQYQKERFAEYEFFCRCCGECCGALNDPCGNLEPAGDGRYRCRIYHDRLGQQKTVSGKIFNCVTIKDNIKNGLSDPNCAYKRLSDVFLKLFQNVY